MSRMFNPPHPGLVLREYLGEMEVKEAAARLGVARTTLSRVLNGRAGISIDLSLRLSEALGTHDTFWAEMQLGYDAWQTSRKRRTKIKPFSIQKLNTASAGA